MYQILYFLNFLIIFLYLRLVELKIGNNTTLDSIAKNKRIIANNSMENTENTLSIARTRRRKA